MKSVNYFVVIIYSKAVEGPVLHNDTMAPASAPRALVTRARNPKNKSNFLIILKLTISNKNTI